jgi:sec-independent protein translocase protein TatA
MEGKIGLTEIVFIIAIALLLFGPSKFASLGKGLGEGIRNFKASMKDGEEKKDETTPTEEKKS